MRANVVALILMLQVVQTICGGIVVYAMLSKGASTELNTLNDVESSDAVYQRVAGKPRRKLLP